MKDKEIYQVQRHIEKALEICQEVCNDCNGYIIKNNLKNALGKVPKQ